MCAKAAAPSFALLHYKCAVHVCAKQFVMLISSISKVMMVTPPLEGDPELVAFGITFVLTEDIFEIMVQDIRQ